MDEEYIARDNAKRAFAVAFQMPENMIDAVWIQEVLDAIPAADVRPVVRGAWIGIDDFPYEDWECSVCGEQVCGNDSIPRDMHYCPNCGADMREVDNG